MKVTLLNDGGYCGLEGLTFPVEVESEEVEIREGLVFITGEELTRVGGDSFETYFPYCFALGEHCVVGEAP